MDIKNPQETKLPMLLLVLMLIVGGILGLGAFTFLYGEGYSYFKDNPKACVNCHVMKDVYDGWNHGTHKSVATCNDCHTPHYFPSNLIVKGINGWNHSLAFTTGKFVEPIRVSKLNLDVALNNCLYCHQALMTPKTQNGIDHSRDCLKCHFGVGHGK